MDETTFRKRLAAAIARINDLPATRREELLALAERVAARPASSARRPRSRRPFVRD